MAVSADLPDKIGREQNTMNDKTALLFAVNSRVESRFEDETQEIEERIADALKGVLDSNIQKQLHDLLGIQSRLEWRIRDALIVEALTITGWTENADSPVLVLDNV